MRFKIQQTAGSRLNIDDIAITSNPNVPVINPFIDIDAVDAMEAVQGGNSTIVSTTISGVENGEDINVAVEGNFEISLNRTTWSTTLTLDPTGEVIYVRIADTGTVGEFDGTLSARTSRVSAYADLHGTVNAKPIQLGDVNMDGSVNISDVADLINYLLNGDASNIDMDAADVDQDGSIKISDVTELINKLLNPSSAKVAWCAYPADGGILCEYYSGELLEVYDFEGNCCAQMMSKGVETLALPAGIYVVASDTTSLKVVVK